MAGRGICPAVRHHARTQAITSRSSETRAANGTRCGTPQSGNGAFMAADEEARAHKLAANQSRFRRSNERLQRAAYSHRFEAADRVPFLCECAAPGCFEAVMLSMEECDRV